MIRTFVTTVLFFTNTPPVNGLRPAREYHVSHRRALGQLKPYGEYTFLVGKQWTSSTVKARKKSAQRWKCFNASDKTISVIERRTEAFKHQCP
jgi:hypothetical protein